MMRRLQSVAKFLVLFLLVFGWIFSGWPQVYQFPPRTQEAQAATLISYVGTCNGTTSCTPPAHQVGDLFLAFVGRDASTTAPTLPSGWTSVTTASINGNSTADSAVLVACKVATTTSETVTGFTNGANLVAQVYRGQRAGTTATCASAILGTPSNFTSTANTTTTTETFNAITSGDRSSWIVGFGYAPAATAGISTAPAGMTNRSAASTKAGGHDTNATAASFSSANVTLTTAGRIITTTVEIKAKVATTPSFSAGTGTYNNDQSITITGDAGDTFCYTTDGSTPAATTPGTCSTGSTYSSPVSITATGTTLKAIATKAGTSNSTAQTATYTLTVGAITSSPGAGTYAGTQSITLAIATTTGAVAHYTTDGSAVSCSSTTYSGAFNISATTTVKAIGCKTNYNSDTAISDVYTINTTVSVTITTDGAVAYGTIVAGGTKTTITLGDTQTAKNDGNAAEDFNIKGQNTACPWTLAATAGTDQYVHEFSTNGGTNYTALTTSYQALISNIAVNGTQNVDLRITTPTSTNCYTQQSASITIQAVQH